MARARRNREINIFNFSFLDVLACTVGALTFILVMVVVINVGSLPADLVEKLDRMAEELEDTRAENELVGIAIENQIVKDDLIESQGKTIDALTADLEAARTRALKAEQEAALNRDIIDAMSAGQAQDDATREESQRLLSELATAQTEVDLLEQELENASQAIEELESRPDTPREENWWHRLGVWRWVLIAMVGFMTLFGSLALWSILHQLYLFHFKGERVRAYREKI